jgi:hypothetical protein
VHPGAYGSGTHPAPSGPQWTIVDALVGITVTGIVYQVALAGLYELHGRSLVADVVLAFSSACSSPSSPRARSWPTAGSPGSSPLNRGRGGTR